MNTRLANVLSAVLHPLLMPTLLFTILFYFAPNAFSHLNQLNQGAAVGVFGLQISIKLGLLLLLFNFTFLLPAYLIYILYRFGAIRSLRLETLADRRQPYLLTTLVYTLLCVFFVMRMRQIPELSLILMSITFCIALVTIISMYWQISAHGVGASGMLGAILGVLLKYHEYSLFGPLLLVVVLTGYLASARLYLNAHTPEQMVAGIVLGFSVSMGTVFLFV